MDRSTRPRNLKTLQWEEEEKGNSVKVLDKLEAYAWPWKNKRIARDKLKLRKQNTGELFDNFVKDLRLILMDWIYPPWWHSDWFDHWWSTRKEASRETAWSWRKTNSSQHHRNRETIRNVSEANTLCLWWRTSHLSTGSDKNKESKESEETWLSKREALPQVWQRPSAWLESRKMSCPGIHMLFL